MTKEIFHYLGYIDISNYILLVTFFAVLWYAWEARKTAKEMEEQNKLQLLPFLVFDFLQNAEGKKHLHIKNIGKGIARNIHCEDTNEDKNKLSIYFEDIILLEPSEIKNISAKKGYGRPLDAKFGEELCEFDFRNSDGPITFHNKEPLRSQIIVSFDSIFGKRYSQKIAFDERGIKSGHVDRHFENLIVLF